MQYATLHAAPEPSIRHGMETISESEVFFLVALSASEESSLKELRWDLEKWDCADIDVTKVIKSLINDGTLLLAERIEFDFQYYSKNESITLSETWATTESMSTVLYLTDAGSRRWEIDDWGITTKRAQHLMFGGNGNVRRVR